MNQVSVHENPYQPAKHNLATARSKATGILLFFVAVFAIVAEVILDNWLTKGGRSIHPFGVQASVVSNYLAGFISLATATGGYT